MRKITIDVDTMEASSTGPITFDEAAHAGLLILMGAVVKNAEDDGWESGEDSLIEICSLMWSVFRKKSASRTDPAGQEAHQ